MKKAKIRIDASRIFFKRALELKDLLKNLEGKVLEVEKEYDDRVVLRYQKPDGSVATIDIEKDLVELEKGLGER
jgi:hypothetical protein